MHVIPSDYYLRCLKRSLSGPSRKFKVPPAGYKRQLLAQTAGAGNLRVHVLDRGYGTVYIHVTSEDPTKPGLGIRIPISTRVLRRRFNDGQGDLGQSVQYCAINPLFSAPIPGHVSA